MVSSAIGARKLGWNTSQPIPARHRMATMAKLHDPHKL